MAISHQMDYMKVSYSNFKSFFPVTIWMLIILVISGYPGNYVPKVPIWQFDKLVHSGVYSVLSICLIIAFYKQYNKENNRFKASILIIFIGIFYGGFMEILQHYIFINRSGNWYDFIANTVGTILGIIIYPFIIKLLPINRWFDFK
jgi:VanZ family protein